MGQLFLRIANTCSTRYLQKRENSSLQAPFILIPPSIAHSLWSNPRSSLWPTSHNRKTDIWANTQALPKSSTSWIHHNATQASTSSKPKPTKFIVALEISKAIMKTNYQIPRKAQVALHSPQRRAVWRNSRLMAKSLRNHPQEIIQAITITMQKKIQL